MDEGAAARPVVASLIGSADATYRSSAIVKRVVVTLATLLASSCAAPWAADTAPPRLIADPGAVPAHAHCSDRAAITSRIMPQDLSTSGSDAAKAVSH